MNVYGALGVLIGVTSRAARASGKSDVEIVATIDRLLVTFQSRAVECDNQLNTTRTGTDTSWMY